MRTCTKCGGQLPDPTDSLQTRPVCDCEGSRVDETPELPDSEARSLGRLVGLRCWWQGHIVDNYGMDTCMNCGREVRPYEAGMRWKIEHWWTYSRPRWMRPLEYFKKCSYCGQRFMKHTDDCPPF